MNDDDRKHEAGRLRTELVGAKHRTDEARKVASTALASLGAAALEQRALEEKIHKLECPVCSLLTLLTKDRPEPVRSPCSTSN